MSTEQLSVPRTVSAAAHGKVNLHLGVGDVRADGYHELTTVFQSVAMREVVTLTQPAPGEQPRLTVEGHDAHLVPTDPSNLAWKAVQMVADLASADACGADSAGNVHSANHTDSGDNLHSAKHADSGANGHHLNQLDSAEAVTTSTPFPHIHITKGVPVAGGMAGGSADAAAALIAGVEYYGMDIPREQIMDLAEKLGADVPFCVLGGTALGTGKGEELVTVPTRGQYHWAIATDKRGLSTPEVFAKLDQQREARAQGATKEPTQGAAQGAAQEPTQGVTQEPTQGAAQEPAQGAAQEVTQGAAQEPTQGVAQEPTQGAAQRAGSPDRLIQALLSADPRQLGLLLSNDLQAPAISLMPSLRQTIAAAYEAGAIAAIVSGSGPTIAMLCANEDHALDVATAIAAAGKASATAITTSPGVGAHLLDT